MRSLHFLGRYTNEEGLGAEPCVVQQRLCFATAAVPRARQQLLTGLLLDMLLSRTATCAPCKNIAKHNVLLQVVFQHPRFHFYQVLVILKKLTKQTAMSGSSRRLKKDRSFRCRRMA